MAKKKNKKNVGKKTNNDISSLIERIKQLEKEIKELEKAKAKATATEKPKEWKIVKQTKIATDYDNVRYVVIKEKAGKQVRYRIAKQKCVPKDKIKKKELTKVAEKGKHVKADGSKVDGLWIFMDNQIVIEDIDTLIKTLQAIKKA